MPPSSTLKRMPSAPLPLMVASSDRRRSGSRSRGDEARRGDERDGDGARSGTGNNGNSGRRDHHHHRRRMSSSQVRPEPRSSSSSRQQQQPRRDSMPAMSSSKRPSSSSRGHHHHREGDGRGHDNGKQGNRSHNHSRGSNAKKGSSQHHSRSSTRRSPSPTSSRHRRVSSRGGGGDAGHRRTGSTTTAHPPIQSEADAFFATRLRSRGSRHGSRSPNRSSRHHNQQESKDRNEARRPGGSSDRRDKAAAEHSRRKAQARRLSRHQELKDEESLAHDDNKSCSSSLLPGRSSSGGGSGGSRGRPKSAPRPRQERQDGRRSSRRDRDDDHGSSLGSLISVTPPCRGSTNDRGEGQRNSDSMPSSHRHKAESRASAAASKDNDDSSIGSMIRPYRGNSRGRGRRPSSAARDQDDRSDVASKNKGSSDTNNVPTRHRRKESQAASMVDRLLAEANEFHHWGDRDHQENNNLNKEQQNTSRGRRRTSVKEVDPSSSADTSQTKIVNNRTINKVLKQISKVRSRSRSCDRSAALGARSRSRDRSCLTMSTMASSSSGSAVANNVPCLPASPPPPPPPPRVSLVLNKSRSTGNLMSQQQQLPQGSVGNNSTGQPQRQEPISIPQQALPLTPVSGGIKRAKSQDGVEYFLNEDPSLGQQPKLGVPRLGWPPPQSQASTQSQQMVHHQGAIVPVSPRSPAHPPPAYMKRHSTSDLAMSLKSHRSTPPPPPPRRPVFGQSNSVADGNTNTGFVNSGIADAHHMSSFNNSMPQVTSNMPLVNSSNSMAQMSSAIVPVGHNDMIPANSFNGTTAPMSNAMVPFTITTKDDNKDDSSPTNKKLALRNRPRKAAPVTKMAYTDPYGDAGLYTGEVDEDSRPHGKGKMKYDNGIFFEGEWVHGHKNDNAGIQNSSAQSTMGGAKAGGGVPQNTSGTRERILSGFTSWKGAKKKGADGNKEKGTFVYGMEWADFSGLSGKYTGQVNDEEVPDGKGVMRYDFGLVAEGNWVKGVLNDGAGGMNTAMAAAGSGMTVAGGGGMSVAPGMSVAGGGGMSVVSGLGMMSIGGGAGGMMGMNRCFPPTPSVAPGRFGGMMQPQMMNPYMNAVPTAQALPQQSMPPAMLAAHYNPVGAMGGAANYPMGGPMNQFPQGTSVGGANNNNSNNGVSMNIQADTQ